MQIDDIESKKLLPNWAHGADWIQAAFDKIVQIGVGRLPAIDAPLTMQAIQCLTDDELREWYARFGVVEYYPDLNRETREKMLYWIARLYRFLGTPHAIRVLCDYIYNDLPLDVTVIDNLAFDGETLVDPALLDLFDVEIDAGSSGISPANAYRLVSNIMRIARNSQTLRKIIYDYASDIDAPCAPCAYGSAVSVMVSDNDELARVVPPPGPTFQEITLYTSSGNKTAQGSVTSTYNGDVSSAYCYQLYTDENLTTPWAGYDYANDYELGRYVNGVWTPLVQHVSELPSTTTSGYNYVIARVLLDIGRIWYASNYVNAAEVAGINTIIVRIYPKDQSLNYHVGYFYSNNAYGNRSDGLVMWPIYTAPGTSNLMTYFSGTTIIKLYGSAGNEVSFTQNDILTYYQQSSNWRTFRLEPHPTRTMKIRAIVFTTPNT